MKLSKILLPILCLPTIVLPSTTITSCGGREDEPVSTAKAVKITNKSTTETSTLTLIDYSEGEKIGSFKYKTSENGE